MSFRRSPYVTDSLTRGSEDAAKDSNPASKRTFAKRIAEGSFTTRLDQPNDSTTNGVQAHNNTIFGWIIL